MQRTASPHSCGGQAANRFSVAILALRRRDAPSLNSGSARRTTPSTTYIYTGAPPSSRVQHRFLPAKAMSWIWRPPSSGPLNTLGTGHERNRSAKEKGGEPSGSPLRRQVSPFSRVGQLSATRRRRRARPNMPKPPAKRAIAPGAGTCSMPIPPWWVMLTEVPKNQLLGIAWSVLGV